MTRAKSMLWLAGGSLVVLATAVFLLYLDARPAPAARPLKIYCAAALKKAMQEVAAEFETETGQHTEFDFGDSGAMLEGVTRRSDGDLFLPADDSYVRLAQERGLVTEVVPLCRMRAVVLCRPGNPHNLAAFKDLLDPSIKVGLANPDSAAIGTVVRKHLRGLGKWEGLATRLAVQFTTVTDSANAVQVGSVDAAIVWDSVASNYPSLAVVRLPDLDDAVGRVELAVLAYTTNSHEALRLAGYAAASDRGLVQFRKFGFTDVGPGAPWNGGGR